MLEMLDLPVGIDPDPVLARTAAESGAFAGTRLEVEGGSLTRVSSPAWVVFDVPCPGGEMTVDHVMRAAQRYAHVRAYQRAAAAIELAGRFPDPDAQKAMDIARWAAHIVDVSQCDHEQRCCREHRVHARLHSGCILR